MKTVQYIPLAKAIADAIAVNAESRKILNHFLSERTAHDLVITDPMLRTVTDWKQALIQFFSHHAYQWTLINPEYNTLCAGYDARIRSTIDAAMHTGNIPTRYADKLRFKTAIHRNFKAALNIDANVWQDCFKVIDFWRCCSYDNFMDSHVASFVFDHLNFPKYLDLPDSRGVFKTIFDANCRSVDPNEVVNGYNFKVTEASIIGVLKDQYGVDASYLDEKEVDLTHVDLKRNNIIVKAETEEFHTGSACGVKIVNKVLAYEDSYKPVLFMGDKWRGPEDLEHLKNFQPYMHNNFIEVDFENLEPALGGIVHSDDAGAEVIGMIAKNFKHLNAGLSGRFKSDEPNESAKPSTHVYEIGNDPKECTLEYQVFGRAQRKFEVKTDPDGIIRGFGVPPKPIVVLAPEVYEAIKNEVRKQLSELTAPSPSEPVEHTAVHIGDADIHNKRVSDKVDAAPADDSSADNMGKRDGYSRHTIEPLHTDASAVGADSGDSDSNSSHDATTRVLDTFETRYDSTRIRIINIDRRFTCDSMRTVDLSIRNFERLLNEMGIAVTWSLRIPKSTYGQNREVITIARKVHDNTLGSIISYAYPVYAGHDILVEFDENGYLTNADFSLLRPESD